MVPSLLNCKAIKEPRSYSVHENTHERKGVLREGRDDRCGVEISNYEVACAVYLSGREVDLVTQKVSGRVIS